MDYEGICDLKKTECCGAEFREEHSVLVGTTYNRQ